MHSQDIQILIKRIQFSLQISKRFFVILFCKQKDIHFFYLDYYDKYLFNNSIIIINYRFRNAIYYKFGNHFTVENQIKLFSVDKIKPQLHLTVYGFFRKQHYILKLVPENILITKAFKTEFSNLNIDIKSKVFPQQFSTDIKPNINNIKVDISNVVFNLKAIKTKHNSFNQTDFL